MKALKLNYQDNVAVVLQKVDAGGSIDIVLGSEVVDALQAMQEIPFCHKIALIEIPDSKEVVKYGEIIGRTTEFIPKGYHVHIHNVASIRGSSSNKKK